VRPNAAPESERLEEGTSRMSTRLDRWTVFAAASLVVVPLLACKKKKPEPTTPAVTAPPVTATATQRPALPDKVYKLGETAKAFDYSLLVENVKECKRRYSVPKKGNIFIGVEGTVENLGDKQFHAAPSHAKIVDAQNLAYNSLGYASTANCDPCSNSRSLPKARRQKVG